MPDGQPKVKPQQALTDFGKLALRSDDLDGILAEACRLVREALGTGRAKILEILHAEPQLLVRARVGWNSSIVGHLRIPMEEHSSETFAIEAGEPVVSQDIRKEDRFGVPPFMREVGVVAPVNVPIFLPGGRAYGLLQVDDTEPQDFGDDEIQFLRTYAIILGPAIDRLLLARVLRSTEERFRLTVEAALDYAIYLTDTQNRIAVEPVLRLSSLIMVRDAVRAGVGAGRLPVSLVSHDLAAGTLVHWGDLEGSDIAPWALYPSRRPLSARVSAFLDHLKEVFPTGLPDELAACVGR